MGVSLPGGGGGGRGRSVNADLNLVPFIDLLSALITFLLATAVWSQTEAMKVDQAINDPNQPPPPPDEKPPTPPLTIHVRADGVWMGRNVETAKNYPKIGDDYDWTAVETDMKTDHAAFPDDIQVVIVTDDGVNYQYMVKALDLSRGNGYDQTMLGGGPAETNALLQTPPPAG